LGLSLNGKDLESEVYESCSVDFVYEEIERLLDNANAGHIASFWEGEQATSLYLYGESFDEMNKCIASLIENYPLCQKGEIIRIA